MIELQGIPGELAFDCLINRLKVNIEATTTYLHSINKDSYASRLKDALYLVQNKKLIKKRNIILKCGIIFAELYALNSRYIGDRKLKAMLGELLDYCLDILELGRRKNKKRAEIVYNKLQEISYA